MPGRDVSQPGRQALVYDLMEPHRPTINSAVLGTFARQTLTPGDFLMNAQGGRLQPDLARPLVAAVAPTTIPGP